MTKISETPQIPAATVDTSSVMRCYVLLGLGMIFAFTNIQYVSAVAMGAMLWGIVWAYLMRRNAAAGGLVAVHTTWMIRTFWVSTVYAVVAVLLWSSVVYSNGDFSSMQEYETMLKTGKVDPAVSEAAALGFAADNRTLMNWATAICHGPVILFVLARMAKGYRLADAGRPVENLRTWKL